MVKTKITKKTREAYLFSPEEDKYKKGFYKQIEDYYKVMAHVCSLFLKNMRIDNNKRFKLPKCPHVDEWISKYDVHTQ